jgi:predicted MFS family arabinose efflux permease
MITPAINLYKNAFSGLTNRIWLLSAVMLVNRAGTMVLPFMTLYCTQERHLSYGRAGWVVGFYGLGSITGAFIGGKLSDLLGFYYVQFCALFLGGIMFFLLSTMQSYSAICICTFFLSMVNESFRPANATAISHYSTIQNRTQSFSLIRLAINLGWGIGSGMAGILASIHYKLLFWVDGGTNIIAAVLLLIILPKVSVADQQKKSREIKFNPASSPYRDKPFLFYFIFTILFAVCFFQLFTTIPLFFKEGLHINEKWIGLIMALNGITIGLFEMPIVYTLEGRRPYLVLISMGTVIMALSFAILNIGFLNGITIALLASLTITLAEMLAMPFMNSWYIGRSNEQNRGQYAAIYTIAWSSAQLIGSTTGTQTAHAIGFYNLWWIISGISLLSATGYFWLYKKK